MIENVIHILLLPELIIEKKHNFWLEKSRRYITSWILPNTFLYSLMTKFIRGHGNLAKSLIWKWHSIVMENWKNYKYTWNFDSFCTKNAKILNDTFYQYCIDNMSYLSLLPSITLYFNIRLFLFSYHRDSILISFYTPLVIIPHFKH